MAVEFLLHLGQGGTQGGLSLLPLQSFCRVRFLHCHQVLTQPLTLASQSTLLLLNIAQLCKTSALTTHDLSNPWTTERYSSFNGTLKKVNMNSGHSPHSFHNPETPSPLCSGLGTGCWSEHWQPAAGLSLAPQRSAWIVATQVPSEDLQAVMEGNIIQTY